MKNLKISIIALGLLFMASCNKTELSSINSIQVEIVEFKCSETEKMNFERAYDYFEDEGLELISIELGNEDECKACQVCRTGRVFLVE